MESKKKNQSEPYLHSLTRAFDQTHVPENRYTNGKKGEKNILLIETETYQYHHRRRWRAWSLDSQQSAGLAKPTNDCKNHKQFYSKVKILNPFR